MYLEVQIDGSGDRTKGQGGDPYRARLNVPKSAVIPSNADGSPKNTTTVVWVDDKYDRDVPRNIKRIPLEEGRDLARQMDPNVNTDRLEQKR